MAKKEPMEQISLRVEKDDLAEADALIEWLSDQPFVGSRVTQADVLRLALSRGLTQLRAQRAAQTDPAVLERLLVATATLGPCPTCGRSVCAWHSSGFCPHAPMVVSTEGKLVQVPSTRGFAYVSACPHANTVRNDVEDQDQCVDCGSFVPSKSATLGRQKMLEVVYDTFLGNRRTKHRWSVTLETGETLRGVPWVEPPDRAVFCFEEDDGTATMIPFSALASTELIDPTALTAHLGSCPSCHRPFCTWHATGVCTLPRSTS